MSTIHYTLLCDGSSDRMLLPILDWLLYQHSPEHAVESAWADLGRLPRPPKSLPDKIKATLDIYSPCDILFIHRDAEKEAYAARLNEITTVIEQLETPPVICVIPVRMQEAWLLFDEAAIRRAAGNPNGRNPLIITSMKSIETLPDPKELLFTLIRESSGLRGARLKKLNLHQRAFIVSQAIADFSPLRSLNAFCALEEQVKRTLTAKGMIA
ncbi:MAG: hypothetical protein A2079_04880 [Geobacteraceae bacterium GWC2_48_7]|nr:MAG: hypothetical protein A2079_04880 [Geobacteraceae bacterium GWC2_48_7]